MQFKTDFGEPLGGCLERMIYFKDFDPPSQIERLVPAAAFFLVVELDGMTRQILDNSSLAILQRVSGGWISGLQKTCRTISAHEGSEMLAVQFRPLGASVFIPGPLSRHENQIVSAELVFGTAFMRLRGDLMSADSPAAKFRLMEDWLLGIQAPELAPPDRLRQLIAELQRSPHPRLSALVRHYPASQRQLIADFKKYVGTTPKFYQRMLRFQSLLADIEQTVPINWVELALRWGFADQAHLIREFGYFSGFMPSEFIGREFQAEAANFFPLVKNLQDGKAGPL